MKELFREPDFTVVGHFQAILEGEGIRTLIRNEHIAMMGVTEVPIPDVFPALCVVNDEDYERARQVIRERLEFDRGRSEEEIACPGCGEANPGNFSECWSCQSPLDAG